jgi:hypothetical protein
MHWLLKPDHRLRRKTTRYLREGASRRNCCVAESDRTETNEPPLAQVEFDINDINSEVGRSALREALKDLNGVRDVQFGGGGAVVTYNPIGITKEEICTAIRRSGYRATEITTSPPK